MGILSPPLPPGVEGEFVFLRRINLLADLQPQNHPRPKNKRHSLKGGKIFSDDIVFKKGA
jgi:hypothetical protein